MSLALDERPVLRGSQQPRVSSVPSYVASTGPEAIELAFMAGLELDEWQQWFLTQSLGEREDGKWAAFGVGGNVPRQNGKGGILEARELAGLFLLDERLVIHSAHQFDTSQEAFERLASLIENTPELSRRLAKNGITRSHGAEGIKLKTGQRVRFRTRTKGGGRGFTADCLILDEAMILPDAFMSAVLPVLSSRPNPQVWYTGSAVDQTIHEHGLVFTRVRDRAIRGDDPRLFFAEWSAVDHVDEILDDPRLADDRALWARANPALGIRIRDEYIESERREFGTNIRGFAVERLGAGDWPDVSEDKEGLIPREAWKLCGDERSTISGPVAYSVDVSPLRDWASLFVAGHRADGAPHVEIVARDRGTEWVVERCAALNQKHGGQFVIDPKGQAAQLIPDLQEEGLEVHELTTAEYVSACAEFFDAVLLAVHEKPEEREKRLRYPDPQVELTAAVSAAATRVVGDAWAWSRRNAGGDITALVAATNALWGAEHLKPAPKGQLAASMFDYLQRSGMADPQVRQDRLKELAARRQARVDAVLKKAKGEE